MTGFGTAEGEVGGVPVSIEVRTVNHRFFNPSLKLPARFQRWEGEVREALRSRISRGHVSLSARLGSRDSIPVLIDEARAVSYVAQLRALGEKLGVGSEIDLATLLRMPDVISLSRDGDADPGSDGNAAELIAVVNRAIDALALAREAEGGRLAAFVRERVEIIAGSVERISERAPIRLQEQRDRLRANIHELAEGIAIDDQRLAMELAIVADRLDVQEELERFRSHLNAFRSVVESGAGEEPVGKRLGFLLQELLREANTTGSKANDVAIVHEVLSIKEELERLREQVENLA